MIQSSQLCYCNVCLDKKEGQLNANPDKKNIIAFEWKKDILSIAKLTEIQQTFERHFNQTRREVRVRAITRRRKSSGEIAPNAI